MSLWFFVVGVVIALLQRWEFVVGVVIALLQRREDTMPCCDKNYVRNYHS